MAKKITDRGDTRKARTDRRSQSAVADAIDRDTAPVRQAYETAAAVLDQHEAGKEPLTWELLEYLEKERKEAEAADAPALEVRAEYRALVARIFEAWPPFTPEQYRRRILDDIVPRFNTANRSLKLCIECAARFAVQKGANPETAQFCSETCKSRVYHRGRARQDATQRWEKHRATCQGCRAGHGSCDRGTSLWAAVEKAKEARAGDALDHASGGESLSMADDERGRTWRDDVNDDGADGAD